MITLSGSGACIFWWDTGPDHKRRGSSGFIVGTSSWCTKRGAIVTTCSWSTRGLPKDITSISPSSTWWWMKLFVNGLHWLCERRSDQKCLYRHSNGWRCSFTPTTASSPRLTSLPAGVAGCIGRYFYSVEIHTNINKMVIYSNNHAICMAGTQRRYMQG